jgi:iron(III) transport system ATP-binding protein
LRCTGGKLVPGSDGAVAIRQHAVRLWASKPDKAENVVPGTVTRQVFLGASRDYMVETADGTQIRLVAGPNENIPQGSAVWLDMPAERCRALSG